MAVVSVASFAKVLLDQITQKLAQEQAATAGDVTPQADHGERLHEFIGRQAVDLLNSLVQAGAPPRNESELVGTLMGYLSDSGIVFELEAAVSEESSVRADMIVSKGNDRTIVEFKSSRWPLALEATQIAQMEDLTSESAATGLLVMWNPDATDYAFYEWPPRGATPERIGVVMFSNIRPRSEPKSASFEGKSLGDILGDALRKTK